MTIADGKRCGALGVVLVLAAASGLAQAPPVRPVLRDYTPVTAERLASPQDGDWLMSRRTYDGWAFSPLTQISTANVSRLRPVWAFSTGVTSGHEAAVLAHDGVLFAATPGNQIIALEAATGVELWRYSQPLPEDVIVLHRTSRGVALLGDKVFFASADARLLALDARSGREIWATTVADNASGYYMTIAPLVAGGKVLVGTSGGEFGIRGFIAAYDPDTGAELWRTYTVPAPGEPGSETWPDGDQWKTGGGSIWVTGNYDPATNIAYWGTGNGGPWMGDQRPGDNLYTSSTVAIDVATGAIKGHFQYTPNESWDWDEVSPPLLVDYRRDGRTITGLVDAARNGYLWFLERTDGPIRFVDGRPYVRQNVFRGLDPVTGRPDIDPDRKPGTDKKADFCPSVWGGKSWPQGAFNPRTRLIYLPANENLCGTSVGSDVTYTPGRTYIGARTTFDPVPGADHYGELQAWHVDTGERAWTHPFAKSPMWGPVLTTAGGLVFAGGTNDRKLRAFDAATGEVLWEFPTGSGILGPPSSFLVNGTQYIAVQSGWGVDAAGMQARLNTAIPGEYPRVPEGGTIWVFAIDAPGPVN